MDVKTNKLIENARSMIGAKWVHQGRSEKEVDCAGLIAVAAKKAGFNIVDDLRYGRFPDQNYLLEVLKKNGLKIIPKSKAEPGDLFVARYGGNAQHLMLFSKFENDKIYCIHADSSAGKVVEHPFNKRLFNHICFCLRF